MSKSAEEDKTYEIIKIARPRKKRSDTTESAGFYDETFSAAEIRRLKAFPNDGPEEMNLLRVKILRLAKLTPLRKVNDKELDTLIKMVRVVAALDTMDRTLVMRSKVDGGVDPALQALAEMDPNDL